MNKYAKYILSGAMCLTTVFGGNLLTNSNSIEQISTSVYAEESVQSGTFKSGLTWTYKNRVLVIDGSGTLNEQEYLNTRSKYDVGAVVVGKDVMLPIIDDEDVKISLFIQSEADEAFSHLKLYTYKGSDTETKQHEMAESLAANDRARGANVSAQDYLNRYVVNIIDDDTDPFSVECAESQKNAKMKTGTLEKSNAVWSYKNRVLVIDGNGMLDESEFSQLRSSLDVGAVVIDRGVQLPVIEEEDIVLSLFIQREADAAFCNSYLYTYSGSDVEKVQHRMAESLAENDRKNRGIETTAQDYLDRYVVNILTDGADPFAVECKEKRNKLPTVKSEVVDGMLCTYLTAQKRLTITGEGELKKATLDALMKKYSVDTVTFLGEITLENNELLKTITDTNGTEYRVYTYKDSPLYRQYYSLLADEDLSETDYVLNVIDNNDPEGNTEPIVTTTSPINTDRSHISSTTVTTVTTVPENSKTSLITTEANVPKVVSGDANGDNSLNVQDCSFIAQALANRKGDTLPESADYNKDGKKNVIDAMEIAKDLAKKFS